MLKVMQLRIIATKDIVQSYEHIIFEIHSFLHTALEPLCIAEYENTFRKAERF